MKILNVINLVEPPKVRGYESCWDCFDLTLEDPETGAVWKATKNREEYKRFVLEQKLLRAGVDPNILEEYGDVCYRIGADSTNTEE